ncbi:MAG: ATP-NAD kinase family protein [Acidimicrobiia bacterium]
MARVSAETRRIAGLSRSIGFLVNPVAGIGGRIGHKGSDDPELRAVARGRGFVPIALARSAITAALLSQSADMTFTTWAGSMGADQLAEANVRARVAGAPDRPDTTAADTKAAVTHFHAAGVDLILFVGGDGTARDIYDAVGDSVPVIGVPAGVKMYSGVFASHPRVAVEAAKAFLENSRRQTSLSPVLDIDEAGLRDGRVSTQLHGYLRIPTERVSAQGMKSPTPETGSEATAQLAAFLARSISPSSSVILGPGTTTRAIGDRLGSGSTLLGVDIVMGASLIVPDAGESELLEYIDHSAVDHIIVSPIGGQGFVLGRGNQQISPEVVTRAGPDRLMIAVTKSKLESLEGRPLLVDSGDDRLDAEIAGLVRLTVAPGEQVVYPVRAASG